METFSFRAKVFLNNQSYQITIPKKEVARFLNIKEGDWVRVLNIEKIEPPIKHGRK